MRLRDRTVCITGGAGFIGSHLADRLVGANEVVVIDALETGRREWVPSRATFIEGDLRRPEDVVAAIDGRTDLVVHCAADKAVNAPDPDDQFRENTVMTANVLQHMESVGCNRIVFTSSSTVYGEAPRPTPEDHAPLEPISMYGAAKLAEEALVSVYAHSKGIRAWTFRFANIVGPRLQRGAVIPDFIHKLRQDPGELEILGNGRQEKSYMHVTDCVDAMCHVVGETAAPVNTVNLGTENATSVTEIAEIVADEMGHDPTFSYTGGDRGWEGDVPRMQLSIERLRALDWEPEYDSNAAVRHAARELQ